MKCLFCDKDFGLYIVSSIDLEKNLGKNVRKTVEKLPNDLSLVNGVDCSCTCLGYDYKVAYFYRSSSLTLDYIYIEISKEVHTGIYFDNKKKSFCIIKNLQDDGEISIDVNEFIELFNSSEKIENYLLLN